MLDILLFSTSRVNSFSTCKQTWREKETGTQVAGVSLLKRDHKMFLKWLYGPSVLSQIAASDTPWSVEGHTDSAGKARIKRMNLSNCPSPFLDTVLYTFTLVCSQCPWWPKGTVKQGGRAHTDHECRRADPKLSVSNHFFFKNKGCRLHFIVCKPFCNHSVSKITVNLNVQIIILFYASKMWVQRGSHSRSVVWRQVSWPLSRALPVTPFQRDSAWFAGGSKE